MSETESSASVGLPMGGAPSAESILEVLRSPATNHADLRSSIVEAEASRFSEPELEIVRPILRDFIVRFRNSSDRIDQIAVGSAIRKYVATMPAGELAGAGFLLEAGPRSSPPLGVELEITKMVVRKLAANPTSLREPAPDLAQRLDEIGRAYLNDRLLGREKYGATALNALLGLALLQSNRFEEGLDLVRGLRSRWFLDSLAHRARLLIRDLSSRFPTEQIKSQLGNLSQLVSAATEMAA